MGDLGSFLEFPLPETKPFVNAVIAPPFFQGGERTRKRPAPLMQPREDKLISLAHLQKRPAVAATTTGFSLDFDEKPEPSVGAVSSVSDDLARVAEQYKNEIDLLLREQAERLRRTLAESWRRQCRALAVAAERAAARRLKEKDEELQRALRLGAELEDRLSRLRAETIAYQSKAAADQASAAALHAQLQHLASAPAPANEEEAAGVDDEESAYVDPDRVEVVAATAAAPGMERPCRCCRRRAACVVLLPCRHLCLCDGCSSTVSLADGCPVCRCAVTGVVHCFLP